MQCLQESIRENPFHEMIENKKSALRKRLRAQQSQQQGSGTPQTLKLSRQKLNGTPSGTLRQKLSTPQSSPQSTPVQQRKTSKHRLLQLQNEHMVTSTPKQQSGDDESEPGVEALPAQSHEQSKSPQGTPSKA